MIFEQDPRQTAYAEALKARRLAFIAANTKRFQEAGEVVSKEDGDGA